MSKILTMVDALRDPNQAKYYHGDLLPDAAQRLEEYYHQNDISDFVDNLQKKLPEPSDFDKLVDELDAVGDEETVDGMMEKVIKISEALAKLSTEQETAIKFAIDESEKHEQKD